MENPKICVVGASNIDLISYVPRLPNRGETLHGSQFNMGFGGKGANQAVMAAKLGANVSIITKLGKDPFGEFTLNNFKNFGIDTDHVYFTDQAFSGVAPIFVDKNGDNYIVIVTGANDLLTETEIKLASAKISSSQLLLCQLEIPINMSLLSMQIAKKAGVKTIFNPAPGSPDLPLELFSYCDIVCPNETELEILTGASVRSIDDAEKAGRSLVSKGAKSVIITLGEKGSLFVSQEENFHVPAIKVNPVDTTGAGDAFLGSLAYYIGKGLSIKESMQRANRVAAISVQHPGTQSSFPGAIGLPEDLMG